MTQHFFGLLAGVSASSCVAFTGYNIAVELNCARAAALQRSVLLELSLVCLTIEGLAPWSVYTTVG
jgi:hypothetical protein